MTGLVFTLRTEPNQRLDLSSLTPRHLDGLSEAAIAALPVGTTRESLTVGDVFAIRMGEAASIRFEGGSERFDRIGEGLDGGEIAVEGRVGARLGRLMRGGRLSVSGEAGNHAGSAMAGGVLEVEGDAGDFLAAPLAGEMTGMSGGALRVSGSAGARAGDRMRRGTIAVTGAVGVDAGSRMIAGTLLVGGRAGATPGRLMRRGTIVLAGGAEALSPTFLDNGPCDLLVFELMRRALGQGPLGAPPLPSGPMRRLSGDTAVSSLGELFLPLA